MRSKSIITEDGWILCGKCGHKLAKVVCDKQSHITPQSASNGENIEFKCQSCKTINVYGGQKK